MKLYLGMAAVLTLASWAPGATPVQNQFRFWKRIDVAPIKDEQIVAFALDSDIYAATRSGYPDLRVIDERSVETPFQIEADEEYRTDTTRETVATKTVALRPDADALEVRIRLPDDAPAAEGLVFDTPLTNFDCKVRVDASDDGATWAPLVNDGEIYDFSRIMDVRNHEIALPSNHFREFKIVIQNIGNANATDSTELTRTFRGGAEEQRTERTTVAHTPFRIDAIQAWRAVKHDNVKKPKTAAYATSGFEAKSDKKQKQTVLLLRTGFAPITRLRVDSPSRNFSRQVLIEAWTPPPDAAQPGAGEWTTVTQGEIFNFSYRNLHKETMAIDFPEERAEKFRVTISNEDNPPINVTGLEAEGTVYHVVFLAQAGKNYSVYYGSASADAPNYDAAAVLGTLRQDYQPAAAQLGAQSVNTAFGAQPGSDFSHLLDSKVFLGGAIVLMVVVLGWALFRAGKRLEGQS